jgi:uncharacterized protein
MRRFLFVSLFILLSGALVFLLRVVLPKYSGMLTFFFFFLVCVGYLWSSVWPGIKKLKPAVRIPTIIVFWLPVLVLFCLFIYGLFVPFLKWNLVFRTYLQSFILVFCLAYVFPVMALFLADLIRLILFTFRFFAGGRKIPGTSVRRYKPLLMAGWMMGGILFLILTAGTCFWQFDFRVREQVICLQELPHSFDGFRIVQFSDVHLGSWPSKTKLQEAMKMINSLNPDVIFFTGDMFNYRTSDGEGFEDILKTLRAPYGIYAILGNHDYGDYTTWPSAAAKKENMADLKRFYKNLGWNLLMNSHAILKRGTDSIALIGVENWGATRRFQRLGDIAKAEQGTERVAVQLLLSHDPSHWDSIVRKKYPHIDITFSGHTHGGQMGIDCCNLHWSPVMWVSRLWCGLYQNPGSEVPQYLYVNQGLGNIGYAGRVGILPEITLFTLKSK